MDREGEAKVKNEGLCEESNLTILEVPVIF